MAVANEIPMLVDLYKNNNSESKGYGMYYGRVVSIQPLFGKSS